MPQLPPHDSDQVIADTRIWLERAVIGLNLCPFAKAVYIKNRVRFVATTAENTRALKEELTRELLFLQAAAPEEIDTTLLIHPAVLNDFLEYNDFLREADHTLAELGLEGEIQIASFHPDYQFADSGPNDIENYSNRSPYPILHLLREASIDAAVQSFPDPSKIYDANIDTLNTIGKEGWAGLGIPYRNKRPAD
jgi:hypothetical protein